MEFGDPRLPQRFWDKVDVDESGCWLWTAYTDGKGYGRFSVTSNGKERPLLAHRYAYMVDRGYDYFRHLKSEDVHHGKCGVKACVRPDHLHSVSRVQHGFHHGKTGSYAELCTGSEYCLCWECCEKQDQELT